jgi:myosin heavy subunit
MLILNATTQVKSVMTDSGDLITILPGQLSRMIIASKNLIISAINLGTPQEIGVILNTSYELTIAQGITGSTPYLYTDQNEAIAKLIDPSMNYQSELNTNKVNHENEFNLIAKDKEIEGLRKEVANLTAQLEASKTDTKIEDLQAQMAKDAKTLIDTQSERDRLKSQLTEAQDTIKELTDKNNSLTTDLSNRTNEVRALSKTNQNLSDKILDMEKNAPKPSDLEAKVNEALEKDKIIVQKDQKIEELKGSLQESVDQIEAMKKSFNEACAKFNITRNEAGEWIQVSE